MNRERFLAYIEAYNTDKGSLARFYAPEIVFENPALTLSGPALMEFFGSLRGTVEDRSSRSASSVTARVWRCSASIPFTH